MHKITFLFLVLLVQSCDLINPCDGLACYPGAPEVYLSFSFSPTTDSSYRQIGQWKLYDDQAEVKLKLEEDTVWNYSYPFMELIKTDTSIILAGTGVIWENLDDLRADLLLDFGNGDSDTLSIIIGEGHSDCCEYNYIKSAHHNGTELPMAGYLFQISIDRP